MKPRSLTRRSEFATAYEKGHKLVGRSCVLYLLPATDDARAVVASRKVGGAVQRNRAKRLLRHMIQAVIFTESGTLAKATASLLTGVGPTEAAPDNKTGLWVVAVARKRILDLDIHAVVAEAGELLADFILDAGHDASGSPGRGPEQAS
ncbi:ribonuclease P protein component [bacterium]|nr:ribonuclease P protein component [bacterium]